VWSLAVETNAWIALPPPGRLHSGQRRKGGNMFGLGMPELLIILVIALLVFGAGRLPEIGSSLGKAIKGFKEASDKPEPEPGSKAEVSGPASKTCPQCGRVVTADAAFCSGCGKKLSEDGG
jgi:sec-independent protein translocase protein TatA